MSLLVVENVTVSFPERRVLSGVTVGIADGERVGVLGRNGAGKTTLLRLMAGDLEPDGGRVIRRDGLRVSYLLQDPPMPDHMTVGDYLGDRIEVVAAADRFGLTDPEIRLGELSGGMRRRAALAKALGVESDVLILDEPTNHLDIDLVDRLEDLLVARTGALVFVTHDRYLLDRLTTRIVEVESAAVFDHPGSYEEFLERRAAREAAAAAAERRRRNRARVELAWLRRGPKARTSKAKYRVDAAREVIERKPPPDDPELLLDLPSRRLGTRVVELHDAGKHYDGRWVVRHLELKLGRRDRIGLVGPNGSGKTTVLSLLAGRIEPDEGRVATGETVAVGWYGQDPERLPSDQRVIGAVKAIAEETRVADGVTVSAGRLLERFLFTGEAQRATVGDLSGGERRRLELLRVLATAPNVLFLDEPTNDLDVDTLEALEEYLDAFPGTVVAATHDRYFLDRVCEHVYSLSADGSLAHHPEGWTGYRDRARAPRQPVKHQRTAPAEDRPTRVKTKLSYNEKRELDHLERRIPELETERDRLTAALDTAGDDYEAATRLGEELTATMRRLAEAEDRWLRLTEEAERLARE